MTMIIPYDIERVATEENRIVTAIRGATSVIISRIRGSLFNIIAPQRETNGNIAVIANLNYPITVILGKKPRSDCLVSLTAKDQIFLKEYVMNMIPDIKIFYYDR